MSEQHRPTPLDMPRQEYTWEDVAREAERWHPGLKAFAELQLQTQGVEPEPATPESPPVLTLIDGGLATEAVETKESPPAKAETSKEEIAVTLAESQKTILQVTADPRFHARCMKRGIDPYEDTGKPKYWHAFAAHMADRVQDMREKGTNNIRLDALELLASTPSVLFLEMSPEKDTHTAKEVFSHYNDLLRSFATKFPETSVADLKFHMANVANLAIHRKDMKAAANDHIRERVRGAQHEMFVGQMLSKTGRKFRPATLEEDLGGIDYVVDEGKPDVIYIDAKASTHTVRVNGYDDTVYTRKSGRKFIVWSMVTPAQEGDSFYLSDAVATTKAEGLDRTLDELHRAYA